jgi:hypothetical protein
MPPRSFARKLGSFTLVTFLGASATGCTVWDKFFDESVSLSELAPATAHATAELTDAPRSQLVLEAKTGCPTMADDIAASVDGKAMDVFNKGQKQPSGQGWICGLPTFRRNVAAADIGAVSTKFVAEDDTATVTVVASGLLLERKISPTTLDVVFQAGVETSFDWSVSTDRIDPTLLMADFIYDDASLVLTSEVATRVEGSLVFIRLPADAPSGLGKLQLDVMADVPVEKCEGVPTCTASVHAITELAIDAVAAPPSP